jgi:hypothetical protein
MSRSLLRPLVPLLTCLGAGVWLGACSYDFGKLFDRDDPQVEAARAALDAGPEADLPAARVALEEVLRFRCDAEGGVDLVAERPYAGFDLGLILFRISEAIGRRFGEEEPGDGGTPEGDELVMAARIEQLNCAYLLLQRLASDPKSPTELRSRAKYLLGNMAFLARKYEDAIARYDEVLLAHPAQGADPQGDAGPPKDEDGVARYAAWNRAIALERLQKNDAGPDAPDASPDAEQDSSASDASSDVGDAGHDGGNDGAPDGGDAGGQDAGGQDAGAQDGGADTSAGQPDAGKDGGQDASSPPPQPSSSAQPPPSSSAPVDLRELDRFDQKAPLDLDFKGRQRDKQKVPKKFDK